VHFSYHNSHIVFSFQGDGSVDGECSVADSAAQWLDCGIPCPVGDESRIAAEDMKGFGGAIIGFMVLCAILGAVAMRYVVRF